jgi:platelet-activating factor acetylhydrolase IB subunit alpha
VRHLLVDATAQTARITDIESSSTKPEMCGHDNVVEVAVFVPSASIPAIRNLVALVSVKLSLLHVCPSTSL